MKEPTPNTAAEYAFLDACKRGDNTAAIHLLASGVSVDCRDCRGERWGMTGLMHAVESGNIRLADVLLRAGAKVNLKDKSCPGEDGAFTALHYAAYNCNREMIDLLVSAKADINALTKGASGTALMIAVDRRDPDMLAHLLQRGADPNLHDRSIGRTALHEAAQEGMESGVMLLLKAGANVNARKRTGATPLMDAAWQHHDRICLLLLKNGADVNAADNGGFTTLMWAVVGESEALVRELLRRKADLNAQDEDGRTALDIAIRDKTREIESVLRKSGAKTSTDLGRDLVTPRQRRR